MELAADGTFIATNAPLFDVGVPPMTSLSSFVSGTGNWWLDSVGSVDNGIGKIKIHCSSGLAVS